MLNEGQQVGRTEEMLRRIEKLAANTTAQLERATRMKDRLGREMARFERVVEQLVVKKLEFETLYRRLSALQTAFSERPPTGERVHILIEQSFEDHEAGATVTSGGRNERWGSSHRRMSHALTMVVTQTPSWAVRHRAPVLAGLSVLALVSFMVVGSVDKLDRISTTQVPQAQPTLNGSSAMTPGTMETSVATSTETAVTALQQPARGAAFEKPIRASALI